MQKWQSINEQTVPIETNDYSFTLELLEIESKTKCLAVEAAM